MNPRIRVAALIIEDESVLLVRHQKGDDSYWLLPGGGVDFGENLSDALVRELKEEVCIDIQVLDLLYVNDAIAPDESRHMVQCCFEANHVGGELGLGIDERVVEVRFVSLGEMRDLEMRPDIRDEIISRVSGEGSETKTYLGMRWRNDS